MPSSPISIVVLGQKDHGKSTLLGRLIFETKSISQDKVKESQLVAKKSGDNFEWAHLLDSFRYERTKGMTLDVARVTAKIGPRLYELIDAPGHKELIKNMISGASEAKYAIIVIAADEGIKKQTVEHARIAHFLGIDTVLVVVNKCDLIHYSAAKYKQLKETAESILKNIGYLKIKTVPLSASHGRNLLTRDSLFRKFKAPAFAQVFKKLFRTSPHKSEMQQFKDFLMVVQDYHDKIAIGQVKQGLIKIGDTVLITNTPKRYRIKKIWLHNKPVNIAHGGENIGLMLNLSLPKLKRGNIIAKKKLALLRNFDASCVFLEIPKSPHLFIQTNFQQVPILRIRTANHPLYILNIPTDTTIALNRPIVITGNFIIRNESEIIGIGKINQV